MYTLNNRSPITSTLPPSNWLWRYLCLIILATGTSALAEPRDVRVGTYSNEPKILLDKNGDISGIFGDILEEIATRESWKLIPMQCNWDECMRALQDGRIDILPDIAYSDERVKSIDFHKTVVLHNWTVLYHREGDFINSMLDLRNKRVAILQDSIQEIYLRKLLQDFGVQAQLIPLATLDEGFKKVVANEADVAVTNRFFGELKSQHYKLVASPIVYQPTQMYFGTRKGENADLLAAIDNHLAIWITQTNSPYFKALEKWTQHPALTVIPYWLIISSAILVAMLTLTLLFNTYLRRKVIEKTRHLQLEQEALEKNEAKLRTVMDNVDAYIYLKDSNGDYQFMNKLARELVQLNMEDIVGYGDEKFFDAITAEKIRHNDQRVLVNGETIKTEETNTIASTNTTATYLSTKLPLRDKDGNIYALCGISIDITERKKMETTLREQREQLQLFIEHAPASLAMFDQEMHYLAVSKRWMSDYALGDASIIGRSHYEIFPDLSRHWKDIYRRGMQGEIIGANEDRYERSDGTTQWLQWEVRPWNRADGTIGGIVIFTVDITQTKQANEELERHRRHLEELVAERTASLTIANAAAVSANSAKSAFLANMSHEIRTPLNAITGTAYLMRRDGVTPQQAERLNTIDNAGQHLLEIINIILDLSKIEAGKFAIEERTIDISSIVNNVVAMLAERAQEKDLKLVVETDPVTRQLTGDGLRLQQSLLNYVSNAIKFTNTGSISLRTKIESESDSQVMVRFEVQDTGIGIAPDIVNRLFAAFEQGDNSMTRQYGGTGLGLAITKKLAMMMGGNAGVVSTPNVGSTFWFTARLNKMSDTVTTPANSQQESADIILARDYKGMRILIADDEPFNRTLVSDILANMEPVIDTATNGVEALELATRNVYDLILMDMQMPQMNGMDTTRHIRKLANGANVPIIALTGNAFGEDKARCLEAGMNDFVTKPFNIKTLFETLLMWLSKTRQ